MLTAVMKLVNRLSSSFTTVRVVLYYARVTTKVTLQPE